MNLTRISFCCGILVLCLGTTLMFTGCAAPKVSAPVPQLTKPKQILVYDFAISPQELKLDEAAVNRLGDAVKELPLTDQELAMGKQIAEAITKHLMVEIGALGIPAVHGTTNSIMNSETLLVKGQFISANKPIQKDQAIVGFRIGRMEVRTMTQIYGVIQGQKRLLGELDVDSKNGSRLIDTNRDMTTEPLAISAVFSSGLAVGSDDFMNDIDSNAQRTAKFIANEIRNFYQVKGWIKK